MKHKYITVYHVVTSIYSVQHVEVQYHMMPSYAAERSTILLDIDVGACYSIHQVTTQARTWTTVKYS